MRKPGVSAELAGRSWKRCAAGRCKRAPLQRRTQHASSAHVARRAGVRTSRPTHDNGRVARACGRKGMLGTCPHQRTWHGRGGARLYDDTPCLIHSALSQLDQFTVSRTPQKLKDIPSYLLDGKRTPQTPDQCIMINA